MCVCVCVQALDGSGFPDSDHTGGGAADVSRVFWRVL